MKTTLILLLAALGPVSTILVRMPSFDASDLVAGAFVLALFAWTVGQYRHRPRSFFVAKPIHLPALAAAKANDRLAAPRVA